MKKRLSKWAIATLLCPATILVAAADETGDDALKRAAVDGLRRYAIKQERITRGDQRALQTIGELRLVLAQELRKLPSHLWEHATLRRALLTFVAQGGPPDQLGALLRDDKFPESEQPLAVGVFAYATGRNEVAKGQLALAAADRRSWPGVHLLLGIVLQEKDAPAALKAFFRARALSPGTPIEETALRLSVYLLSRHDRDPEMLLDALDRYVRRFPKAPYFDTLIPLVAKALATNGVMTQPHSLQRLRLILSRRGPVTRSKLLTAVTVAALRQGRLDDAKAAIELLEEAEPNIASQSSRLALFRLAATVLQADAKASETLRNLERRIKSPEEEALLKSIRSVVDMIHAGPESADAPSEAIDGARTQPIADRQVDTSQTVADLTNMVEQALESADRLIKAE